MSINSVTAAAIVLFCLGYGRPAAADHIDIPTLIPRTVETVFAPLGFDDNDNVEVVLHGQYSSSCYTNGPTSFEIDAENKKILIKAQSYFHVGAPCIDMTVPYLQTVKLGMLKAGTYQLQVEGNTSAGLTPLVVSTAPSESRDDYMYASIESANVTSDASGKQTLNLIGYFPKVAIGCLIMKDIKFAYTPGNILVVLPVMEMHDGWKCTTTAAQPHFMFGKELPTSLVPGSLVHVRSANGESYNALFH